MWSLLLLAALSGLVQSDAEAALRLTVTPHVSHDPGTFRVKAIVDPNASNRRLTLVADSPQFFRSSTMSLEGAQAARSHARTFNGLPAGQYTIRAKLERNDGTSIVRETVVKVVGPRRSPEAPAAARRLQADGPHRADRP